VAIPCTASSNARTIGILRDPHNYSLSGDALTASLVSWFPNGSLASGKTQFPSHSIEIASSAVILRADYYLASTVAVVSNTTTTIVVTAFEQNFDGGFLYVNAGVGIGQLAFVDASDGSGNITIPSALTTALTSTSKLTKILPYFEETPVWKINGASITPPGTLLDSTAAAGTGRAVCLGSYIEMNTGAGQSLDPLAYHNYQNLNSLNALSIYSLMALQDCCFTPIT
jgi:hypothetical protein